jgi:hypothetical protein
MLQRLHDRRREPGAFELAISTVGGDCGDYVLHEIGVDHLLVSNVKALDFKIMVMLKAILAVCVKDC